MALGVEILGTLQRQYYFLLSSLPEQIQTLYYKEKLGALTQPLQEKLETRIIRWFESLSFEAARKERTLKKEHLNLVPCCSL